MKVLRYNFFVNETKDKSAKEGNAEKVESPKVENTEEPEKKKSVPKKWKFTMPKEGEPDFDVVEYYKDIVKKKSKKEGEEEVVEVRQPTPIEPGDYVEIFDFDTLNKDQIKFLTDRPYFLVRDVVDSKGRPYSVGEPHVNVGYKTPLKMSRFRKVEKTDAKYKVLFLQFDLPIDLHGEEDPNDFFRGFQTMSEIFTVLFHDKLKDDVFVNFNNYDDIYKIKNDYYINGIALRDYDFVFFGHISNFTSLCKMIVSYLDNYDIPYLKYGTYQEFDNKAYEFHLLDSLGYPYIPSIMTTKLTSKIISIVENEFGFPVIVKDVTSNRGTGVYKMDDMKKLIRLFSGNYRLMLIQKHVPNDGDFRVITLKRKVQLVIKKQRIDENEFRSNVARGGKAIKASLPKEILDMCEEVAKHLDGDIIGFDIIQNKDTKEYYIMEANAASHFPTFSVISGVNIPEIIIDYIIKKIKK